LPGCWSSDWGGSVEAIAARFAFAKNLKWGVAELSPQLRLNVEANPKKPSIENVIQGKDAGKFWLLRIIHLAR
jgi:hypothetical protein